MKIDIYTFAVVLGITYTIQFIIFFIEYQFHKNYKGPGWWLMWSSAAALGFSCMVFRQIESLEHIAILCQNTLHILATYFLYIGFMRFLGRRERIRLLVILFVIFILPFSYFIFIVDNIHIRTIMLWSMVTIIATISAYDLHRFKTKSENTAVLICVTALIIHAFFAGLKVVLLLNGSEIISLTSQVLINTSTYMEVLIVSLFWTYGIIMMINQRLTAEMKRSKDQFEIIFNTSPDAIIITTLKEGIITSFNDKFSELAGYKLAELVGKTSIELNLWKNQAERAEFVAMVHKKGYHFDYEIDYRVKDNSISTGLISSRVIQLNDKEQMISIIRDISDRKQREKEIIVQNIELQTINREKDKFFSIIAHDLKSPFSSFLGLTEIMAEEIPNLPLSEVIQLAAKMRDSARNLYGLLVNLLEWSLITQGLTKFNPVQMPLLQEIKESMLTYRVPALKKNIQILIEVADECQVYADQNMLRSLVRNLLSNAIKFTREGGSVFVTAVNQADQGCVIAVKDTGIGISAEMQQLLFKGTSKNYFFDAVV